MVGLTFLAHAKIERNIPLKEVVEGQKIILVMTVAEIRPETPGIVLVPKEKLRGEFPFERVAVNLKGNETAEKEKHSQVLLDRIEKGSPIMIFSGRRGMVMNAFGYVNGTWFQLAGNVEKDGEKETLRWRLLECEPNLRKTFAGTTEELIKVVQGGLKGEPLPPINEKAEPGFGPPLKKKISAFPLPASSLTLFGVIQLPFLGLIAALAALFPALFGGLAVFMKRWVMALSAASLVSLLLAFYLLYPKILILPAMKTPSGVWYWSAALVALFAIWAGVRYRKAPARGKLAEFQPNKLDRIALPILFFINTLSLLIAVWLGESLRDSMWLSLLVLGVPLAFCSAYVWSSYLWNRHQNEPKPPVPISAEVVGLWSGVAACVTAGTFLLSTNVEAKTLGQTQQGEEQARWMPQLKSQPLWVFQPKDPGEILATPCVTPDHVIVAVHHRQGFEQYGTVYALDPNTGEPKWVYDADGTLLAIFCSPVYADGKIFFGEGYHTDRKSRMFCLDAKTGTELWRFQTSSHTESTPAISDGIVTFGAGDDGLYAVSIADGKKLWQYQFEGANQIHVDSNPAIFNGKVYAGSGTSNKCKVNSIFALDLKTGKEIWKERTELSVWGSPTVAEGKAYFPTGNGTFSVTRDSLGGMLLCRDAETGKPLWEKSFPNSLVCRPTVDRQHVFVGDRDGTVYGLNKRNGKLLWSTTLGSPILASPTIAYAPNSNAGEVVYALSSEGLLGAFAPQDGKLFWSLDLRAFLQKPYINTVATPVVIVERFPNEEYRRIYLASGAGLSRDGVPEARLICIRDSSD